MTSNTSFPSDPEVSMANGWLDGYKTSGFHFQITAFSAKNAQTYINELEAIEYRCEAEPELRQLAVGHVSSVLPFADEITRLPAALDPVKAILGPDVLVWNARFFIKEPQTEDFIRWHQD